MQKALARRKEEEERKKREEEERTKKEEEERLRLEEIERLAEEAKHRKKEREKEKLLKKKQAGKLLTGKQKEEARRREAIRNQILASAGGLPVSAGDAPAKRPIYEKKKKKKPEKLEEVDSEDVEEKSEVSNPIEEKGVEEEEEDDDDDDDDDEWDAKSWDVKAESETEEIKGVSKPILLPKTVVPPHQIEIPDSGSEKIQNEVEVTNKIGKKEAPISIASPLETEESLDLQFAASWVMLMLVKPSC